MIDKIRYKNIIFKNLSEKDFSNLMDSHGLFTFPAAPPLATLELNSEYHIHFFLSLKFQKGKLCSF